MDELYVPNTSFKVMRGKGKIQIYKKNKLYKEIKDRFPTGNTAFAVSKLLKKFPELAKQSMVSNDLYKVAEIIQPYANTLVEQLNEVANNLEESGF